MTQVTPPVVELTTKVLKSGVKAAGTVTVAEPISFVAFCVQSPPRAIVQFLIAMVNSVLLPAATFVGEMLASYCRTTGGGGPATCARPFPPSASPDGANDDCGVFEHAAAPAARTASATN